MKSVLLLQNEIMEYRKAIYNCLAKNYLVTVLHSGAPSIGPGDHYSEIITPATSFGRFHLQHESPLSKIINDYDVVVAMFDLSWPAYLAPLLWRKRPKYLLWGHRYSSNKVACALRDFIMQKADKLIMYGDEEIDRMISRGIDPKKITIAWNTIHVANHRDYSQAPKTSLIFVGRLQERKRVDLLITLYAKLQGRIKDDIILDIIGTGEIESKLRKLAENLSISDKVIFHGRIDDQEQLSFLFSKSLAYVSPGPVGLGVLHSLAYGVPVLTLRKGRHGPEFHNLTHRLNSLICANEDELFFALQEVCTNGLLARQLGSEAYQHYTKKRTISKMLEGFIEGIEG